MKKWSCHFGDYVLLKLERGPKWVTETWGRKTPVRPMPMPHDVETNRKQTALKAEDLRQKIAQGGIERFARKRKISTS